MNLTIACERALASPQLALIDAQILDQARDLTLATLDECAAATTEVLSSLLPINSTAGGGDAHVRRGHVRRRRQLLDARGA